MFSKGRMPAVVSDQSSALWQFALDINRIFKQCWQKVYCLHETVLGMCHSFKCACRIISASGAGKGGGVVQLVTTRYPKDGIKTQENQ